MKRCIYCRRPVTRGFITVEGKRFPTQAHLCGGPPTLLMWAEEFVRGTPRLYRAVRPLVRFWRTRWWPL